MKYKRILLKLSGEALMGEKQYGIDIDRVAQYAKDIHAVHAKGIEIAVVIGGVIFTADLVQKKQEWTVYRLIIWECWQL